MPHDVHATPIPRRLLGRTGMRVTELAFGGVAIGSFHEAIDDTGAVTAVHRALSIGINYVDTSPLYKESERRVGLALAALGGPPDGVYLSTKTGTHPDHLGDYSAETTRWSVDNSLSLLGVDSVDLVLVHDPKSMEPVLAKGGAVDELMRMKDEGKIRAIGLGQRSHAFHRLAIQDGRFDALLTFGDYNLVRQTASSLIDDAHAAGIGVIVAQAVLGGQLAGPDPLMNDRMRARPESAQAHAWWAWARERGVPLQAVALQWVLRNPRIGCILIGPRTAAEVAENMIMASYPLPDGIWGEVDARIASGVASAP